MIRIINIIFMELFRIREFFGGYLQEYLIYFKLVSMFLTLVLFGFALYLIVKTNFIGARIDKWVGAISTEKLSHRRAIKSWQQIKIRMRKGEEADLKLALIEADKILDEMIKLMGFRGEVMADRLKQITPAQLSNIGDIWEVHKMRNRVVHDVDYHITKYDVERAIQIYARAFKEMGLLD